MDEDMEKNEHQDDQEDHGEHESHECNNKNASIHPPQDDNYAVPQEHDRNQNHCTSIFRNIQESNQQSESCTPTSSTKKAANRIVPSFSGENTKLPRIQPTVE